jgi:hypothetical protein
MDQPNLAHAFHHAVTLVDNANFDSEPLPAHDGGGGRFDKLYAHHVADFLSQYDTGAQS